jgi:hypothetical protein
MLANAPSSSLFTEPFGAERGRRELKPQPPWELNRNPALFFLKANGVLESKFLAESMACFGDLLSIKVNVQDLGGNAKVGLLARPSLPIALSL